MRLSRSDDLYQRFAKSVAPSVFGSLGEYRLEVTTSTSLTSRHLALFTDIKKAITCLLFGGSKKILPDGMRLRGDINVLLLGDPGTAKSQLLKFVEKVSPIAVYTSGKGSSAAGLTASVQRDPNTVSWGMLVELERRFHRTVTDTPLFLLSTTERILPRRGSDGPSRRWSRLHR